MTLWFAQRNRMTGAVTRRNLDAEPSPTINARCDYLGNVLDESYWLEADDPAMALWLHVRDPNFFRSEHDGHHRRERPTAKTPERRINLDVEPCPVIMANGLRGARLSEHHIEEDGILTTRPDDKPPYRVPSMPEIARIEPNGLKVVSTFAGCGGSSLGYRMAGFKVLWASEFVEAAREVYQANAAAGTIVDGRDIRKVDPLEVLRTLGLKVGELDVLDGSPPCASFSTAGKRQAHWGKSKKYSDVEQRTDDLFFEFIRFVKAMKPRAFVAENVSGLVKGAAKGYFIQILAAMKACGYRVEARLLDAQWLGVPQTRQRIIFVGVRDDLGLNPAFPSPLSYRYSVRDALPWVSRVEHDTSGLWSAGEITDRAAPTVTVGVNSVNSNYFKVTDAQGAGYHSMGDLTDRPARADRASRAGTMMVESMIVEPETDISRQAIGREYDKLNPGQQSEKYFSLVRADAGEPSPTVTAAGGQNAGIACVVHPTEKRKFAIAELKRICAFPDDFALSGSYSQQWERLGRAVPPVMMRFIAEAVRGVLQSQQVQPCAESPVRSRSRRSTSRAR